MHIYHSTDDTRAKDDSTAKADKLNRWSIYIFFITP